jgi:Fe-S cluster assembly protein SufD
MLNAQGTEPYLSAFEMYLKNGGAGGPDWVRQLRQSAIARFAELGFPTTRDEDWKYTNVDPIRATRFERGRRKEKPIAIEELNALSFTDGNCNRLVFIDGVYTPGLSSLREWPRGGRVQSLADALKREDAVLRFHLSRYVRFQEQPFAALNTAFVEDGALVVIPEGHVIEDPLYFVFVAIGEDQPVVFHPRNLIVAEPRSQARIVEIHIGLGRDAYFANAVTEIVGGEDASIEYYLLQRQGRGGFHVGALEARLERQCALASHSITLGGSLVRNDAHVVLDGEGAECSLNGLYILDGRQQVDNHTEIEHCKPHTRSQELYKGILTGSARGVFNGKIFVHKDAQKTDARQTNKNLLLSENAVVNTKPQLEIYADDVKCSHGSTVGQLDRDALFYLRSRGIGLTDAQSLLSYAFASEVVGKVHIAPLRARLNDYLLNEFKGTLPSGLP